MGDERDETEAELTTPFGAKAAALIATLAILTGEPVLAADSLERLDGSRISIAEIERRVPELLTAGVVPGLGMAVIQGGEIAYIGAFGVKDASSGEPVGAETSFAGLSFSKTVFAYLVLRLVEQGVLELDHPLHEYLPKPVPEYEFYTDLAGDTQHLTMTARMALSHTTGWPNWRWFTDEDRLFSKYPPGKRFSYSGEGFAFLQLAVEELTGRGLAELAEREVFGPLGMTRSSFVWREAFADDFATDHDRFGMPAGRDRRDEASAPASLQTTAADYARFLVALMKSRGLPPARRDEMLSPQIEIRHRRMFGPEADVETDEYRERGLAWGLGWGLVGSPHGQAHFHTGNDRGSANYTVSFPGSSSGSGTAIVLLGNAQRLETIAPALVELVLGDVYSPFDFIGYVPFDAPAWEWPRRLARDGVAAGMAYYDHLDSAIREENDIAGEAGFVRAGEDLVGFRKDAAATEFYRLFLQRYPSSTSAHAGLARAQLAAGDASAAVASFDAALALTEPESQTAHDLTWLRTWAAAQAEPHPVAAERLQALAGTYGPRHIAFRDGALFYYREGTAVEDQRRLIPISEDTFVMAELDSFRLRLETDEAGRGVRTVGLYQSGETDQTERGDLE